MENGGVSINPPPKVRAAIYFLTSLGSLVATYLVAREVIGVAEVALWTGFTTLVAGMAGFNTVSQDG